MPARSYVRDKPLEEFSVLGLHEVAEILDVEKPRIGRWVEAGILPKPKERLHCGPVWDPEDVFRVKREREEAA